MLKAKTSQAFRHTAGECYRAAGTVPAAVGIGIVVVVRRAMVAATQSATITRNSSGCPVDTTSSSA